MKALTKPLLAAALLAASLGCEMHPPRDSKGNIITPGEEPAQKTEKTDASDASQGGS